MCFNQVPKFGICSPVVSIGSYPKMNLSFKMLNKTCDASFLNRGGIELETGRKLPPGRWCRLPTKITLVPLSRQKEGGGGREGEGGSSVADQRSEVWSAWKIRKCISSLSPDTCSCQGCYLLWRCQGSSVHVSGAQNGVQLPRAVSSHPLCQKTMWNTALPSCLETELSGKALRKDLKTCPLQEV